MNSSTPYGLDLIEGCLSCPARESGVFCRLGSGALADLDAIRQTSVYPKGAVLFVAGQVPSGIFVLCTGRAKLTVTSRRGHSVILGILGSGEVLGLAAVVSNTPFDVSAEIMQPAQVNFIPRTGFLRLIEQHSDAALRTAEYLSLELRRARSQAARIALSRTVRSKLAGLLLELARAGRHDAHGLRFRLGLTHEELAEIIGTSRETVSRLLNDFRRQGLVRTNGGLLTLPDPRKLLSVGG